MQTGKILSQADTKANIGSKTFNEKKRMGGLLKVQQSGQCLAKLKGRW